MEKLLLEACLEVMKTDALVGIQDMGAAGLTCSTSEMGSRGGAGVEIDVSLVPQRETGMTPYEIMLSESQERMLLVVKRGREAEVERIFDKWDLHAVRIGEVTADGRLRVKDRGDGRRRDSQPRAHRRGAGVPPADGASPSISTDGAAARPRRPRAAPAPRDRRDVLLTAAGLADHRQQALGVPAVRPHGADQHDQPARAWAPAWCASRAPTARWRCRSTATAATATSIPRRGAMLAVAEAARNVACAGARPLGATNCLNFGNPERPAIMWQFAQAVEGIGEACRALDVPITGGNVSLYNETDGQAIYPTPVIGVVGLLEHADRVVASRVSGESGDVVVLLGEGRGELGGSEYLKLVHGLVRGRAAGARPRRASARCRRWWSRWRTSALIRSAHDCSDGGLAVTLAECCFDTGGIGAEVSIDAVEVSADAARQRGGRALRRVGVARRRLAGGGRR